MGYEAAESGGPETPAELERFGALTTPAAVVDFFEHLSRLSRSLELKQIGTSGEGRPILAARIGPDRGARTRIVLFAQQHGNEPAGMEALLLVLRDLALERGERLPEDLAVWVVPQVNPDGAAAGRRENAAGTDLNRRHLLLDAPELRALYSLVHEVRPQLTVDLHEFNVERPEAQAAGLRCGYDLMAEGPTNPNVGGEVADLARQALETVERELAGAGFRYRRYLLGDPSGADGPPRYSNPAAYDGRNVPALFGAVSFIFEAMRHTDLLARLERRVRVSETAVRAVLAFASQRQDELTRIAGSRSFMPGDAVAFVAAWRATRQQPPLRYAYWRPGTGESGELEIAEARTSLEIIKSRPLPDAYWLDVGAGGSSVLDALAGHGIPVERLERAARATVETDLVDAEGPAGAGLRTQSGSHVLPAGAQIVRCAGHSALPAALLLDAASADGIFARGLPAAAHGASPFRRVRFL